MHKRTRWALALAVVPFCTAAIAPSADAAVGKSRCRVPSDGRVLERTRGAVVYRVTQPLEQVTQTGSSSVRTKRYVGCLRSKGRRYTLAQDGFNGFTDESSRRFALAGRWVASARISQDDAGRIDYIDLFDIRSGTNTSFRVDLLNGPDPIRSVVVSPAGRLAWMLRYTPAETFGTVVYPFPLEGIYAAEHNTAKAIDTSGSNFNGLRLSDTVLHWTSGATPKSRRLASAR